jgi:ADP-dependent phosphofructokinase/glucokinase
MSEKIALGFGDNVDYEILWDSRVVEDLIVRHDIHAGELNQEREIYSERDLVISILSFLHSGAGGERFVSSSEIIEHFSQQFQKKITLGGTSVRAAVAMRTLGHRSALHLVTINEHVRRLIPADSPYVCSNSRDTLYPHLIVQFGEGAHVRANDIDIRSSRANRIIYHNDTDNIRMHLNEGFARLVTDARVLLVSGFNAMQDRGLLIDRLGSVLRIIRHLPQDAHVYCEDAGFYNPNFRKLIYTALAGRISIYGLNEDELQSHLGREVNLLDADQIKTALEDLHQLIGVPLIVVHSMYWALAYGENAESAAHALRGGVTMATTRFRYGDDFTPENYREVERLPPNPRGVAFAGAIKLLLGSEICCTPVAQVDQTNATTVGLGDAFVGGFLPELLA